MQSAILANWDGSILEEGPNAEQFFELGMMYSTGENSGAADLISAHKWFNLAAMSGYKDGARLRHEIAAEMSGPDIIAAQRAARDWRACNEKRASR